MPWLKLQGRQMNKVILVVLDGLNYAVAEHAMGYLLAECQAKKGHLRVINCELPSLSRPLYECILTGIRPVDSGIVNNQVSRLSTYKSIFHYVKQAGLVSGAAAYHWVSELYNRTPFDPIQDRHVADNALTIPYAHFYFEDHYPDSHLFLDAEHLRRQYHPDFLFIHSMNIDDTGHHYGSDSPQYRNMARKADSILSNFLPQWLEEGYQVIITADHGMNCDRSHGGDLTDEQQVPLFIFGHQHERLIEQTILQTDLCALTCQLLNIPHNTK